MTKEYSPFTPGVPVPLECFVGRSAEINRFIESVRKSIASRSIERLFVEGERGIGKSSVCKAAVALGETQDDALGLHVFLGGVDSLEEMVRKVFDRLLRESADKPWYSKVKAYLGDHIRQVGLFGFSVEFSASKQELARAVDDFVPAMRNLLNHIPEKNGIVLVLDDINGLASSPRFANWFKSLVDEMATTTAPFPITIALAGLAERRRSLLESQPSLARVFDIIAIKRFGEAETREFFETMFAKVKVNVDAPALDLLCRLSGGYPVFMHELGDAVFRVDTDGRIDHDDALAGVLRGAEVIGAKYVEPQVFDAIRSRKYRGILRKIAKDPLGSRFLRRDAIARLTQAEAKVFDNFLRRMRDLGVLRRDGERGPGAYEFSSELYYLFFWLQARSAGGRE